MRDNISGKDLLELGILRGEMVGKTLEKLLEIVLDEPEKNKKEILLEEAKKYL